MKEKIAERDAGEEEEGKTRQNKKKCFMCLSRLKTTKREILYATFIRNYARMHLNLSQSSRRVTEKPTLRMKFDEAHRLLFFLSFFFVFAL